MAHSVIWVRRWSALRPTWSPLPISRESRSFQPPLPANGCQSDALLNRAATWLQSVSGNPLPFGPGPQ